MVSVLALVPLAVIVVANTLLTAILTRLFRVRLETDWGAAAFVAIFVPVAQLLVVYAVGSVAGPSLGSRGTAVALLIALPLALGVAIDVFWMPAPAEVELPAHLEE